MVRTPSLFVPLVKFCMNLVGPFAGFFFFFLFFVGVPLTLLTPAHGILTQRHTPTQALFSQNECACPESSFVDASPQQ